MKYIVYLLLFSIQCLGIPAILSNNAIHHPIQANNGMVASQEAIATNVGIDILKEGGNAIDAAVAVGFTLAVTLPQAGNLGGGGFMMIYIASENRTIALDFRETAPSMASKNMFLDKDNNVDTIKSRFTLLASGVPGTVHGLMHALDNYGTLPRKKVIYPAYNLATKGFPASPHLHKSLKLAKPRLSKQPYTRSIFYKNNNVPKINSLLKQPDLAKSLIEIIRNGSNGFYTGKIAKLIHTFMENNNGLITRSDLKKYRSIERTPVKTNYKKHEIYSMPPPSSGGITMAQILNTISPYPLKEWGHNSAKSIHIMSQAMSLAYADRSEWLGDSDFVSIPQKTLLSQPYTNSRQFKINENFHTPSFEIKPGKINNESNETTHYCIVDKWGNAVSVTTTLNFSYGSGIAVPGTGILLNNEMDDFSAKPGAPNAYGLIGNEKNSIEPNKRMLSSMSPTIVIKDNKFYLATGSPGGSRIITTVVQILSNVIDHNMNIAEATHAPRFHHQWQPDELRIEQFGFSKDTINKLKSMNHTIVTKMAMGSTQSIMKVNNTLYGASDPRKPSALTVGY